MKAVRMFWMSTIVSLVTVLMFSVCGAVLACDQLVVLGKASADGNVIWAKNSNRPNEECMTFSKYPGGRHSTNEMVQINSHLKIPQAPVTYTVMGGHPYWAWGMEFATNEYGVSCGNELINTKDPVHYEAASLTGEDLVRLGVERGKTAYQAMHVIIDMIEKYGQSGSAAAPEIGDVSVYWNSFLIADPKEAWVLEASDRRWVAKKVTDDIFALTNICSIGAVYDECSPDLLKHAIEMGWYNPRDEFNFAFAYNNFKARPDFEMKGRRAYQLLNEKRGKIDVPYVMSVLRDNKLEGSFLESRFGPMEKIFPILCGHTDTKSIAGSMISHLRVNAEIPESMRIVCWAAMASPDCSPYRPFYFNAKVPKELEIGNLTYSSASPWWAFDKLDRMARRNEEVFLGTLKAVWSPYEAKLFRQDYMVEQQATQLFKSGNSKEATSLLSNFVQKNCDETWSTAKGMANVLTEMWKVVPGPAISVIDPKAKSDSHAKVEIFK